VPRPRQLHVPGGTYHVSQSGGTYRPLFTGTHDYDAFANIFTGLTHKGQLTVHAYCWMPESIQFAATVAEQPLATFMQRLASAYTRHVKRHTTVAGPLYRHRYRAALIDADKYLLPLVRYLHELPAAHALDALATRTSHAAYSSKLSDPCVDRTRVEAQLQQHHMSYAALMQSSHMNKPHLFRRLGKGGPRIIGDAVFIATLPRAARPPHTRVTLEEIIRGVVALLALDIESIASKSRARELVLARALIAWLAVERGVCSLTKVGERLRRDPSTLSITIARYRSSHPHLFRLDVLSALQPLA